MDELLVALRDDETQLSRANRRATPPDWSRLTVIGALPTRFRDRYDVQFAGELARAADSYAHRCRSGQAWPELVAEFALSLWALDRAVAIRDLSGLGGTVPEAALASSLGIGPETFPDVSWSGKSDRRSLALDLNAIRVDPCLWFENPIRVPPPIQRSTPTRILPAAWVPVWMIRPARRGVPRER